MSTIVFFHAHPDDESIATGGSMARAAAEGHTVGLVIATGGEYGEAPPGVEGIDALRARRAEETYEACRILGVHWCEFLGYTDSGMMGAETNEAPGSFWCADIDEAATRLAAILEDRKAEVLTVYDDHGNYGHPDHIQVHRVGIRAAELAGTPVVLQATVDRDLLTSIQPRFAEAGLAEGDDSFDFSAMGTPAAGITTRVDVRPFLEQKRAAMAAHRSQISETSFFLAMPDDLFEDVWGEEWFIRHGAPSGTRETWFF